MCILPGSIPVHHIVLWYPEARRGRLNPGTGVSYMVMWHHGVLVIEPQPSYKNSRAPKHWAYCGDILFVL